MEEFDTSERAHPNWPDRFFARLVDEYLSRTHNRGGRVGDAPSFLLDARGLLSHALSVMESIGANADAAR
jgi:hypothetical protein